MEYTKIKAKEDLLLDVIVSEAENAKANVMIMHGMAEYKERYLPLINRLTENGYNVVMSDMRGHGKSVNAEYILGHCGTKELIIDDYKKVYEYMVNRFPNLDNYLFAHSMGTLNAREYLMHNDMDFKKVILSGTVCYVSLVWLPILIAKLKSRKPKNYSKILFAFSNGGSTKEDMSWLSYNEENVKKYVEDPFCGFKFTNLSNKTLFELTSDLHKVKEYECKNKDLKILSISGVDDRTTGGKKGLKGVKALLNKAGYQNVEIKEYPHMKHEILMEKDNEVVFEDILKFYAN